MRVVYELDDAGAGAEDLPGESAGAEQADVKGEHFAEAKKRAHDQDRVRPGGRGEHPFPVLVHSHQTLNLDLQHQ